jgi:hypothetical protein
MATPNRMIEWLPGPDRRATERTRRNAGHLMFGSWLSPEHAGRYDLTGWSSTHHRPYVTDDPPFTVDEQGEPFPANTLWVCMHSSGSVTTLRPAGNTDVPRTLPVAEGGGSRIMQYVYIARGIPAGAVGAIRIYRTIAGTDYSITDVFGSNGRDQILLLPEFTPEDGEIPAIESTWDLVPVYEAAGPSLWSGGQYWAVPDTLHADFTLRPDDDCDHGGDPVAKRIQSDYRRARSGPNYGLALHGLIESGDYSTGQPAVFVEGTAPPQFIAQNIFIANELVRHEWGPSALDGRVFEAETTVGPWPDFGPFGPPPYLSLFPAYNEASFLSSGVRRLKLYLDITGSSWQVDVLAGPPGSEVLVSTASYSTGAAPVDLGAHLPAHGVTWNFIVRVYWTGGDYSPDSCTATIKGSPRCDIPWPFSAAGEGGLLAPGGYLASKITTPANAHPLTRLAAGVSSSTSVAPVAFIVPANGWYKVTGPAGDLDGIGENEFGWQDAKTVDRGHAGRSFYAWETTPGTKTLTALTPTVNAIASGGTTLTMNTHGVGSWWFFGSIAAPAAGRYRITVKLANVAAFMRGIVAEWSTTDPTVFAPEGRRIWEPYRELLAQLDAEGETDTPPTPASQYSAEAWIVGTAPTGAWAGHPADLAVWVPEEQRWEFHRPTAGSYVRDANSLTGHFWFDGRAWHDMTDPVLTFDVEVPGAQTISLCLGAWTSEYDGGAGNPQVTIGWAAV